MTKLAKPIESKAAPTAMTELAGRLKVSEKRLVETLKNTAFKGAKDEEFTSLVIVANEYRLNPLLKEIYAFPQKGGGIVPVVGIDGWLRIINDHPQMDGLQTEDIHDDDGNLVAVQCEIYRKDRSKPTVVREYLAECERKTEPWKMKHRMLRHKAIIQCGRVAFGLGGIHDEDEARDIERNVTSSTKVRTVVDDDPMTAGVGEKLELTNEPLSLDERIGQIANEKKMGVGQLLMEAAEAGIISNPKKLTDDEKRELIKACS